MGGAAPPWALGACARPGPAQWLVPAVLGSLPQRSPLGPGWHVASPGGVLLHRVFSSSGKKPSCWIKLPSRPPNPSVTSHENMLFLNKVTLCQPRGEGNGTPLQYCCPENPMDRGAWWAAVHGVAKSQTRLSDFTFTFHLYALEKEMATHSSVLAWRIPWTEQPGRLQSMGSHRVGHD